MYPFLWYNILKCIHNWKVIVLARNEQNRSQTRRKKKDQEQLGWKSTTTYTVIKRLSERGVLKNENTIVTSLVSKDAVQAAELEEFVEKTFEGSLPAFLAAFTRQQKLSDRDIDEVQAMIDRIRKGER